MCPFGGPLHLLLFDHALADHLIDGGLDEPRADAFAIAMPLTVNDDRPGVVRNVG